MRPMQATMGGSWNKQLEMLQLGDWLPTGHFKQPTHHGGTHAFASPFPSNAYFHVRPSTPGAQNLLKV